MVPWVCASTQQQTREKRWTEKKNTTNKQNKKKKGSARCCISALLRLSLRFLYIYVYDAKMADPTNLVVRRHRLDDGLADPHVFIYLFIFFFILKPDQRQKSSVCYFFQTPSYPPGLCFDMGQVNVIIRHFFFFHLGAGRDREKFLGNDKQKIDRRVFLKRF